MIPVLYDAGTMVRPGEIPGHNGVGIMAGILSCEVTETTDGIFELALEYPMAGPLEYYLQTGAVIKAECGKMEPQFFRIYRREKTVGKTVSINAEHLNYLLNREMVKPLGGYQVKNWGEVINMINQRAYTPTYFNFGWDDGGFGEIYTIPDGPPRSIRNVVLEICARYGFDFVAENNFYIYLPKSDFISAAKGRIETAVNLVSCKVDEDDSEMITGYTPYIKVDGPDGSVYRTFGQFKTAGFTNEQQMLIPFDMATVGFTGEEDNSVVNGYFNGLLSKLSLTPPHTVSAKYVDLDTPYKLWEMIHVNVPGVYWGDLRVVSRTYDVLRERNKEIELGNISISLASLIAGR